MGVLRDGWEIQGMGKLHGGRSKHHLGGGFNYVFIFSPKIEEMIPNLTVRIFFKRVRKNQLVISIYFRLGVPCLLKGSVYDV